jgi:hypothetical protein
MKNSVIAISSIVITTLVYALVVVATTFFEMNDNAYGEETKKFVVDNSLYTQQIVEEVEKECKSPCPSNAEMCIEMCA